MVGVGVVVDKRWGIVISSFFSLFTLSPARSYTFLPIADEVKEAVRGQYEMCICPVLGYRVLC